MGGTSPGMDYGHRGHSRGEGVLFCMRLKTEL